MGAGAVGGLGLKMGAGAGEGWGGPWGGGGAGVQGLFGQCQRRSTAAARLHVWGGGGGAAVFSTSPPGGIRGPATEPSAAWPRQPRGRRPAGRYVCAGLPSPGDPALPWPRP